MFLTKYHHFLFLVLTGLTFHAAAQDTTFYNTDGNQTRNRDSVSYYTVSYTDPADSNLSAYRQFGKDGNIKREWSTIRAGKKYLNTGRHRSWYDNGQLKSDLNYHHDTLISIETFWPTGKQKRTERYENNEMTEGRCFASDGSDTSFYNYEIMPVFPGGESAFYAYLQKEIRYPRKSRRREEEGKVVLQFIISKQGKVQNVRVVKSVSPLLDEEAVRVVKAMPSWSPALQDGEPVRLKYTLPVSFRLR